MFFMLYEIPHSEIMTFLIWVYMVFDKISERNFSYNPSKSSSYFSDFQHIIHYRGNIIKNASFDKNTEWKWLKSRIPFVMKG